MMMMKKLSRTNLFLRLFALSVFCGAILLPAELEAQEAGKTKTTKRSKKKRETSPDAQMEYNAQFMLNKGIEYLEAKQDERGIKMISQVGQQYPESKAAVKADLVLGNYYIEKKQYDLAIKRLLKTAESEDPEIQAESLYKAGICYYNQNQYNQAFMSLRQVVNKFPGSVYANEACYYIGLCHFSLNRWTQAVEALEKVGTSVPPEESGTMPGREAYAEAGQRLYVKVYDEDLVVFFNEDENRQLTVSLSNTNGDKEQITMEPLGKEGATFIGSIPTVPGEPKPNDSVLQTKGGDVVTVTYLDTQTGEGERNKDIIAKINLVSTATVGFTNGDFQDYAYGVFADQDFFMRVRDLDMDKTPEKDRVKVKVTSLYKEQKEEDPGAGVDLDNEEPEFKIRDEREYELVETEPRSGVFVGVAKTYLENPDLELLDSSAPVDGDAPLRVQRDDILTIEYLDEVHIAGTNDPVTRLQKATLLTGEVKDVNIEHLVVKDLDLRARKNLVEAKMLLQLGQIFKEVGLLEYANNKAAEGVEKIDDLLKINAEASLERSVLEDAFNIKWELLIVQNKIQEAINVCSTLIKMFPDSSLVDRALMKIAEVKIQEGSERSINEGLNIYRGILQLPKSDLKAEAQYRIAEVKDTEARKKTKEMQAKQPTYRPNYSNVMLEYKKCSDNYPDSPFAGQALEKIADFYIETEDFPRVIEMMEQVFRDYPDADFLHNMLYKWAIAAYKLNRFEVANEKCEQLMSEYPNSISARKAQQIKQMIQKRVEAVESN